MDDDDPSPPPTMSYDVPPPPKDRPPALESSKRKWHPSTWRYRIEEVQPELGSKPRRDGCILSSSSTQRERDREREREKIAALEPPNRSASPDKEDSSHQIAHSESPNRQSLDRTGVAKKQGQKEIDEVEDEVKRNGSVEGAEKLKKRKKKERIRKRIENDAEICKDEGLKRGERDVTPSELYFCEICSGRLESSKARSPTSC